MARRCGISFTDSIEVTPRRQDAKVGRREKSNRRSLSLLLAVLILATWRLGVHYQFFHNIDQTLHADPVMPEDIRLAAGDGVFVGDSDDFERHGNAGLHQHRSARLTEAAVDAVFFDGHDR